MTMGQEPSRFTMPGGLLTLAATLERGWPAEIAALHASGVPLNLYDDLTDEQLRERAAELGIQVADDADRDSIAAAIQAKEKQTKPPWGDDANFDADRAWKLIQGLRNDVSKLKAERDEARAELKKHEDAKKSAEELAAERAAEAERRAATAEGASLRLEVALEQAPEGMSIAQVRKLAKRLTGSTREELEADAEELFADFVPEEPAGGDLPRRPRERLRPGARPSSEVEETDPEKLAALVPRSY